MQLKYLFRLAEDLGETRETARDRVLNALGVERLEPATRADMDSLSRRSEPTERRVTFALYEAVGVGTPVTIAP